MGMLMNPSPSSVVVQQVTPQRAGWKYLSFQVVRLSAGQAWSFASNQDEVAFVPLSGRCTMEVAGQSFVLARKNVFSEMPHVLYVPPNEIVQVYAESDVEMALGGAPGTGSYPLRLFAPAEMASEIRGGNAARRQVNHILAHPLPAERLIVYEVYVPGGHWSGWPPHCHDGHQGSPYLEETYYFRIDQPQGFAIHRNFNRTQGFEELFAVHHDDLVLVSQGYHSTAAAPNCNLYFLNFLAGDLSHEARATPPFNDPDFAYLKDNWDANPMPLPVNRPSPVQPLVAHEQ